MDAPADIEAFVREFERGMLPKTRWTHETHLLIALWYLDRHEVDAALPIVRQRIRACNDPVGTVNSDSSGYHESLTRLYLHAIAAHRAANPADSIATGYRQLLETPIARRGWVEPDFEALTAFQSAANAL